jgi:nicotinate-nucleotide--dimethylbenzimidazole phosphoribosyltransferase
VLTSNLADPGLDVLEAAARIRSARMADAGAVLAHLEQLCKPPGSLGMLEQLALRLALIYGDPPRPLQNRLVVVLAADHGVAAQGVSAYPQEVTRQMCATCAAGKAAINVIASVCGAEVLLVDVGVIGDEIREVLTRRVRAGSRNLAVEPALTRDEVVHAIRIGMDIVRERAGSVDVFALGEMGIGNTTAAAALTAVFTGAPAEAVTGTGTGISSATLKLKQEVIRQAVARVGLTADPLHVLAHVGGIEIAALVGVVLGAAVAGRAVVTDGFIATAASLTAVRIAPTARDYLFASHRSTEPGHCVQLEALGLEPLMSLGLRLGEGTGAALALPIIDSAGALLREMATFEDAGVSGKLI